MPWPLLGPTQSHWAASRAGAKSFGTGLGTFPDAGLAEGVFIGNPPNASATDVGSGTHTVKERAAPPPLCLGTSSTAIQHPGRRRMGRETPGDQPKA
jgi:hypothetical protein